MTLPHEIETVILNSQNHSLNLNHFIQLGRVIKPASFNFEIALDEARASRLTLTLALAFSSAPSR